MFVGKVKGSLWATRKDENLNGLKFLVVERQLNEHQSDPALLIVADCIGAGEGDQVMVTTGSSARMSRISLWIWSLWLSLTRLTITVMKNIRN